MTKIFSLSVALAAVLFASACASGQGRELRRAEPPTRAPSEAEAGRILGFARTMREEKGCAAAAPAYRVVAGMGEGFEPAQHELGECLLRAESANPTEQALLREEGLFWLRRAAYAGNARAQRALAVHFGAAGRPVEARAEALKWALVYQKNADADLYGYKALPATFAPGLKAALPADAAAEAEAFAQNFSALSMPAYEGPPQRRTSQEGPPRDPFAGMERRRR